MEQQFSSKELSQNQLVHFSVDYSTSNKYSYMGLLAAPKVLGLQQQILFDADPFTLQEVTERVLPNQ